jgi:hypothetical protein
MASQQEHPRKWNGLGVVASVLGYAVVATFGFVIGYLGPLCPHMPMKHLGEGLVCAVSMVGTVEVFKDTIKDVIRADTIKDVILAILGIGGEGERVSRGRPHGSYRPGNRLGLQAGGRRPIGIRHRRGGHRGVPARPGPLWTPLNKDGPQPGR